MAENDTIVFSGARIVIVEGKVEFRLNRQFLEAYVAARKPPMLIATVRADMVIYNRRHSAAFRAFLRQIAASISV